MEQVILQEKSPGRRGLRGPAAVGASPKAPPGRSQILAEAQGLAQGLPVHILDLRAQRDALREP